MTEERLTSPWPVAPNRPSSPAVAQCPEADEAGARDVQLVVPGVDPDGDDAKLAHTHDEKYRAPEWA